MRVLIIWFLFFLTIDAKMNKWLIYSTYFDDIIILGQCDSVFFGEVYSYQYANQRNNIKKKVEPWDKISLEFSVISDSIYKGTLNNNDVFININMTKNSVLNPNEIDLKSLKDEEIFFFLRIDKRASFEQKRNVYWLRMILEKKKFNIEVKPFLKNINDSFYQYLKKQGYEWNVEVNKVVLSSDSLILNSQTCIYSNDVLNIRNMKELNDKSIKRKSGDLIPIYQKIKLKQIDSLVKKDDVKDTSLINDKILRSSKLKIISLLLLIFIIIIEKIFFISK